MSMRRRLLLWLLTSLLAGGLAAAAVVFVQARTEVHELFDYQLRQLALTLRDRSYSVRQLAEVLQGEEALDFVIQVWAPDGTFPMRITSRFSRSIMPKTRGISASRGSSRSSS